MELHLDGKTVLVTGASSGLGKGCALALAREGAQVIIASRNGEKLNAAKAEIEGETGRKVIPIVTDVSDREAIDHLFKEIRKHTDEIYGLVCNAGGPPLGSFKSLSEEDWYNAFETNLMSVVRLVKGCLELMGKEGGRIVAIASSAVKVPIDGLILSNTMRSGVQSLMKTLSRELGKDQILVNTVCPGMIYTERLESIHSEKAKVKGITLAEVDEEEMKKIPLGRFGTPEEFGQVVAYLLSPANTYITGSTIMVDGGLVNAL